MRAFRFSALFAALLAVVALLQARDADRRPDDHRGEGDRHPRRARVIFYEHADFRGTYFVLEAGEQMSNLNRQRFANGARANDRVSSIRIEGEAEVLAFRDANFQGGALRLTHSVHNLAELPEGNWNDLISSVRVEPEHRGRPDRR
jgi:hypothetical protein